MSRKRYTDADVTAVLLSFAEFVVDGLAAKLPDGRIARVTAGPEELLTAWQKSLDTKPAVK